MSHYFLSLFTIVFVIQLSFIIPSSNGSLIDHLKEEIEEQKRLNKVLSVEVDELTRNLTSDISDYNFTITFIEGVKNLTSTAAKMQVKKVKELYYNLTVLNDKAARFDRLLQEKLFVRMKYDAAIVWLTEDISILQGRQDAGDDQRCFKFEKKRNYTSRSYIKIDDPNEVIALEDELNDLKTGNLDLMLQKDRLIEEIKIRRKFYESQISNLNMLIKSYITDITKTSKDIDTITLEIEKVTKQIASLQKSIEGEEDMLKKDKIEVEIKKGQLLNFSKSTACYKKIEVEVLEAE